MSWQENYDRLYKSPVFLDEEQHVYIHKKTLERYTSVTTVLSLVKNEFPHGVKSAIIKQYEKFIYWINKQGYTFDEDKDFFLRCLELYFNYKEFRPYTNSSYNGKTFKQYKQLSTYKTINSFLDEFLLLEETHEIDRKKNVYLNNDGTVMSEETMQQFWHDITDVANIYGTMVHEIVEQYILLKQRFIDQNGIENRINERFDNLTFFLKSLDYPLSKHTFEEYYIQMDVNAFKQHIINSFNSLGVDLGDICVPERLMFNEKYKVSGMCDVFIENCDKFFSIGDHKTNKDFTYVSKYGNKLKEPFENYDECDLVLYNLQLSIYALLYEIESGKTLKDMWISYYSRKESKFIVIELQYLREEALKLITLHKNFLSKLVVKYNESGIFQDIPNIFHNHLMFIIEKTIKKHKAEGFYDGKTKQEVRVWFDSFINGYVEKQQKILVPLE